MLTPKAWRLELGYSHRQMGVFIGLPERRAADNWQKYEIGFRLPSIDILARCEELSGGRVTAASWLAVTMQLPQIPPGRLFGTRLRTRLANAAHA